MEHLESDIALYSKINEDLKNRAVLYTKICKANHLERDYTIKDLIENALELYMKTHPVKM